jgi:hypothetical protein
MDITQFGPFIGINNVDDPKDIGNQACTEAENVDFDNQGQGVIRDGYALYAAATAPHSGFGNNAGDLCLFVEGSALKMLNSDATKTTLRTGLIPNVKMSYCEVNNQVYYSNRTVLGYVENKQAKTLPTFAEILAMVTGREYDRMDLILKFRQPMRAGDIIRYYNGRLYTVLGGTITFSDPLAFYRTDRTKNTIQVPGRITMFEPVADGFILCWGDGIWFAQGGEPKDFVFTKKASYNVKANTTVRVEGGLIGDGIQGEVLKFGTERGICIAGDGGLFQNLTMKKYVMPTGTTGAALYRVDNGIGRYIAVIQN